MQMTLDGYSTGPNDEMDYIPSFNDERMWHDIHEEMWKNLEAVDTLILGLGTYQIYGSNIGLLQQTILRARRMIEGFRVR